MPFVPTVTFANGTVMNWTDFDSNNVAYRVWARGIPVGDVNAGAIHRENLVRPVLAGFPLGGMESGFQSGFESNYGIGSTTANVPAEWGSRRKRLTFNTFVNDGVTEFWYFPIGKTFRLLRQSDIEVHCSLEWQTRSLLSAAGGATYPNGAGGPVGAARGGFFALHYRRRANNQETVWTAGVQHIYSMQDAGAVNPPNHQHGMVSLVDTLAAGVWDVMLVYHRGGAPAVLYQVDIGRVQMTLEIL